MGKYYKNSLKGQLTRRLLVLVLVAMALLSFAAAFIFFYYIQIYDAQTGLWLRNLGNINSK
jgi:capsular polysaccharide biosynthesis protein